MRFAAIRGEAPADAGAGIPIVIATENPVRRYDDQRGYVVSEVLTMAGLSLRAGRSQIPIVDSHDDTTVRNILGSVRNLRIEGDELVGDAYFAHDPTSQDARQKLTGTSPIFQSQRCRMSRDSFRLASLTRRPAGQPSTGLL
jgi:hypothetical protein